MSQYFSLAPYYDKLTRDVDHAAFVAFYRRLFDAAPIPVRLVLDLGCGTGSVTRLLAQQGYEMIGVDASAEMLAVAAEKCAGLPPAQRPLFLQQDMQELDLYGTVDAAVCALDGFNYVATEELPAVFQRLRLFVAPGGLLIFDVNTPLKLRGLDGGLFVDEAEDVYCVMRTAYDPQEDACVYGLDLFCRHGSSWARACEEHVEYIHTMRALRTALHQAGFGQIRSYSGADFGPRKMNDLRVVLSAVRK